MTTLWPRVEITHKVAGILVRRIHLDAHDGFEQRGTSLLHGFLEGKRAGNLEGDIRGIDIVILAIVEDGAEVHDGKSGEIAAGGRFANAFFDRGNPVLRNGAAEDIVDELDAFAALDRLHLDAAHTELAVAAG